MKDDAWRVWNAPLALREWRQRNGFSLRQAEAALAPLAGAPSRKTLAQLETGEIRAALDEALVLERAGVCPAYAWGGVEMARCILRGGYNYPHVVGKRHRRRVLEDDDPLWKLEGVLQDEGFLVPELDEEDFI